ncbi:hypothetical protein KIS1582_3443 [Cytobacillus firmus]|uniref:Uncharacterized protein n=1 Tax=Cytobacillus firmus TaxID=1399 RepID=A0A800MUY0_CYTFI|nr:hypothetical protein KIS1582_3443 [Cytobacillus firmus]
MPAPRFAAAYRGLALPMHSFFIRNFGGKTCAKTIALIYFICEVFHK